MKRRLSIFLAFCLIFTACSVFNCIGVRASGTASDDGESSEESTIINLLETEEEASSDNSEPLEDTGASYDLIGLSGSPDITAESAIVMDARSGEIIYAKQADVVRYPASITKVMTTLIAIENCKMDEKVSFTSEVVNSIEAGSSTAGINAGAELTVEDTLYALMLVSANEAGAAIADHVSGSNEKFAKLMTKRAKELGCTNTNFKNPHGLPDPDHYTTAHDMGLILKEALKHEEFRTFASTISHVIESDTLTNKRIELWNHAKILRDNTEYYYKYAKGAKTGYTMAANNTLVTYAEKDGMQLLCVILKDYGADQSYYDTIHLYDWSFDQLKSITPLSDFDLTEAIGSLENLKQKEKDLYLSLNPTFHRDYPLLVKKGFDTEGVTREFRLDEDKESGRLGYVEAKSEDEVILSLPVTYDTSSSAALDQFTDQGGKDDLQAVRPVNKNSPLKKIGIFLLRIAIAALLIFVIMQLISRWQLEKKRQARIKGRQTRAKSGTVSKKYNSTTRKSGSDLRKNKTVSGKSGSGSGQSGTVSGQYRSDSQVMRNRRHKQGGETAGKSKRTTEKEPGNTKE